MTNEAEASVMSGVCWFATMGPLSLFSILHPLICKDNPMHDTGLFSVSDQTRKWRGR